MADRQSYKKQWYLENKERLLKERWKKSRRKALARIKKMDKLAGIK